MKVTPVSSPHQILPPNTSSNSTQRAIEAFNKAQAGAQQGNAQETPVANPNSISAEEISAIRQSQPIETKDESPSVEATDSKETPKEAKHEQDIELKRQFEQLARQERVLRQKATQQQAEMKAKEDALAAREAAIAAKDNEYRQGYLSKDRFKQDPLAALTEAGVSYDDITNQILNQVPTDPRVNATISRLEAKIAELEGKTQAQETSWKEQQAESYRSAVKQIEVDTKNLVKSDSSTFEAISKTPGAIKEVVKLIEETFHKDGVLLSVEEAAQEVEDYLVDQGIKTYTQIEKIKKRLSESSTKAQVEQKTPQAQKTQSPMKTLTNSTSSTRQLSAKERAMLAFKGELK